MKDKESAGEIWHELLKASKHRLELWQKFCVKFVLLTSDWKKPIEDDSIVELMRKSLVDSEYRYEAVQLLESFGTRYQIALIDDLLEIAVYGETKEGNSIARKIIISLPKEWLESNFRTAIEHWLQREGSNKFAPLLFTLCADIDPNLAMEFAEEALKSDDEGDRDIGEWMLEDYLPKQQHKT